MSYEPEMMIEEIMIALETGICPRCGEELNEKHSKREWEISCPGCKTVWGGSI